MRTILVTGAAGFIGSNFVRLALSRQPDATVLAFDKLTYAGNLANLESLLDDPRLIFVRGDLCDADAVAALFGDHAIDGVVHFAAETHVDRSILSSRPFIEANVLGTQVLLDACLPGEIKRFIHVSTDEVYGSLPLDRPDLKFTEESPLCPNSPYSASKAAADCLVRAYCRTYEFPGLIARSANNFGPRQFPEKIIPLFVTNLLEGAKLPIYGDGLNVRDWIHVEDNCEAIWAMLTRGRVGEVYNIGADNEMSNRTLTEAILREMGRQWDDSVIHVRDRPGHDRRYAIDSEKARRELGWQPRRPFADALARTIRWYRENSAWWQAVKTGAYRNLYQNWYGERN